MIYVVAFDPIKIMTCWAPQNDCQNLSFVKATNVVDKKWLEILVKWPFHIFVIFVLKQNLYFIVIIRKTHFGYNVKIPSAKWQYSRYF